MGLPMWHAPNDGDVDAPGAKVDKAAATRRSTIRREATVRPNRLSRAAQEPVDTRYRSLRRWHLSLERERRQIDHLEAELERLRRNRIRMRAEVGLDDDDDDDDLEEADAIRTGTQESHLRETLLPEPVEARRSEASGRSSSRLLGASRSSQLSTSPERHRNSRRPYMPSPPYSQDSRRSPDGPLPHANAAELTPNFAPAQGRYRDAPESTQGRAQVIIQHGPPSDDGAPALETPPPEDWESSLAPLSRQGAVRRPRQGRIDGLGDRRRSFSQNSSSAEEDTWETLLTTMDNDEPSSTTQNSFSSAASYSHRSSQTAATSFGEIGPLDDSCDLDLPQGITEDDARALRERHQDHRVRRVRDPSPIDTGRDRHPINATSNPASLEEIHRSSMRQYQSLLDGADDLTARTRRRANLSLPVMRQEHMDRLEGRTEPMGVFVDILDRMQRREEVPRELWASVGLSPIVWENVRDAEREVEALVRMQGTSAGTDATPAEHPRTNA